MQAVFFGESVHIRCSIENAKWKKESANMPPSSYETFNGLLLINVTFEHTGTYTCYRSEMERLSADVLVGGNSSFK